MEKTKTAEGYYEQEHLFKDAILKLRDIAIKTEAIETCKWGMPVYTIQNKNVFGICRFKEFFGVWFFNGVFLKDPKKVLRNAQNGKTKAMRHWNFTKNEEIDTNGVLAYMNEAIANQKLGKVIPPQKKSSSFKIPELLQTELNSLPKLKDAFDTFPAYKQKEFCEYITEAKQEKTKLKRLAKIVPMILSGTGLNDAYRKN